MPRPTNQKSNRDHKPKSQSESKNIKYNRDQKSKIEPLSQIKKKRDHQHKNNIQTVLILGGRNEPRQLTRKTSILRCLFCTRSISASLEANWRLRLRFSRTKSRPMDIWPIELVGIFSRPSWCAFRIKPTMAARSACSLATSSRCLYKCRLATSVHRQFELAIRHFDYNRDHMRDVVGG